MAQTGHVLNGVGPIDQGMSGAGMAAPQDALTALHWNPAAIFAVPGKTLDIGIQFMMPTSSITSSAQQNAFGPPEMGGFGPPMTFEGSTDSGAGPFPIPSIGYVHNPEGGRLAWGFSMYGVGVKRRSTLNNERDGVARNGNHRDRRYSHCHGVRGRGLRKHRSQEEASGDEKDSTASVRIAGCSRNPGPVLC